MCKMDFDCVNSSRNTIVCIKPVCHSLLKPFVLYKVITLVKMLCKMMTVKTVVNL